MDVAGSVIKKTMIIKEIHIDGFGIFNKYSVSHFKEGINILIGKNEAGKSTMLKFIRYTLFGYPRFRDQRMQPIYGGNHGGRIKAIVSSNKELIFERKGNDQITLDYEGKSSHNQSQWFQFLGNATKEVFDNIYAFSLDELVDMKSISSSGVEDKLFSIGMGLGNVSIAGVENSIQNQIGEIYMPRGSKQQVPVHINEIQNIKNQLFKIQDNLPLYQELTDYIKLLEKEIEDIENSLKKHGSKKESLEDYLKCYESYINIVKIDEVLGTLPEIQDYPVDGREQLNELELEEKALHEKSDDLQHGGEYGAGIKELLQEIEAISLNHNLISRSDKINYLRANHELYKQMVHEKTENDIKIKEINRHIQEELLHINASWSERNIIEFHDEISQRDRIRNFKAEFDIIENNKRDLEAQLKILISKGSPVHANNLIILVSLVLLLGAIPAFYYNLYVLGGVCIILALLLFTGRKYILRENLLERTKEALACANDEKNAAKSRFEEYLEKNLYLDKTLSINAVIEILDKIEHLKKHINERNELVIKQTERIIPFINEFKDVVRSVLENAENKLTGEPIEILVSHIIKEFDETTEQLRKKEELENILSARQKELNNTRKKLEKNKQKLTQLLKSIHAKDKDDFRKKYELNDQVKDLTEKRRNAVVTIETIAGLNKAYEVTEYLKTREQHDIKEESEKLEEEIHTMRETLNGKNKELGEKKAELKQIEGASDLADIMTRLESQRQKLDIAYKEWIAGKIALKIMAEVKETYEREKQPAVIKNSGVYFSKITNGRYKRIKVSLDERDITVFDPGETSKKIEQLSRGTREQLLISLRLGFIEEYEIKTEPLPVIIDEVLVNFDPHRAKKTAAILQEFGKKRQILIFTCHPSILEYFSRNEINPIMLD